KASLGTRGDLARSAEEAMPVERRPSRFCGAGRGDGRDYAVEVRRPDAVLERGAFWTQDHRATRRTAREQEARDDEIALHAPRDLPRIGFIFHARDRERGGRPFDDA